jgi:chaperonin GroES
VANGAARHAEVLRVGFGHTLTDGTIRPLHVKPGDHIYFAMLAGSEIRIGRETYIITREEEVFGIIPDALDE